MNTHEKKKPVLNIRTEPNVQEPKTPNVRGIHMVEHNCDLLASQLESEKLEQ